MQDCQVSEHTNGMVPRDGANGNLDPYLLSPVDLQLPSSPIPKRPSVVFVNVPLQRNEVTGSETEATYGRSRTISLRRGSTFGSLRSLLSTTSSVLPSGYTYHHVVVFVLTYCSYMLFHAMRKTFSTVKASLVDTWMAQNVTDPTFNANASTWNSHQLFDQVSDAQDFLGALDAVFMFCYAAGLYVCGILGDRFDPRLVLTIGMCGTSVVNILFGCVTEWTQFYSIPFYVILWIINGFVQGTGWPAVVCVMGNWFGRCGRGFVLGFWSSCQSMGNIVGAYMAMGVMNYGYEYAFLVNASLLFGVGIIVFFALIPAPRDLCLADPDDEAKTFKSEDAACVCERPKPIKFFKAVLLPGVIAYSLAYACLKLVNYSIFFWLPYYLNNNFGWPNTVAASVSSYYDWGGVVGGTVGGIVSDWLGKRTPVVSAQLLISIAAFGVYTLSPNDQVINGVLMGIVGFFVSGSANLVSAAVAADLGRQEAVRNSAEALSTVSGIVDGTGSAGAAFGQIMIPLFETWFGWNSIFYMFMVMLLAAFVLLSKLCYRESKQIYDTIRLKRLQLASGIGHQAVHFSDDNHDTKNRL